MKLWQLALNGISGLALLLAAAWFSYNVFSTRDASEQNRVVIEEKLDVNPATVPIPPRL